jgi:hypothetical protein
MAPSQNFPIGPLKGISSLQLPEILVGNRYKLNLF